MTMLLVDWGYILNTALVGFLLVIVVLTLLVGLMVLMGRAFSGQKPQKQQTAAQPASESSDDEVVAAITAALKIYTSNLHDKESEVITIHKIKSVYSPWSSKIHGLTQLPDYKRK